MLVASWMVSLRPRLLALVILGFLCRNCSALCSRVKGRGGEGRGGEGRGGEGRGGEGRGGEGRGGRG